MLTDDSLVPPVADNLRTGLGGLAVHHQALAARAAAFVATGSDPDAQGILAALAQLNGDAGTLLGQPGRAMWHLAPADGDAAFHPVIQAGLAARHRVYQGAGCDAASVAMLVRLGQVLAAADAARRLDRTCSAIPAWLQYLLNDALWASLPDADATMLLAPPQRDAALAAALPAWEITLVAALLAHGGMAPALAVPVVFERQAIPYWLQDLTYARLLAPGALDDYLLAHVAATTDAADGLSRDALLRLVRRIGANPALVRAYGALLVRMAAFSDAQVRAAAARVVRAMPPPDSAHWLGALLDTGTVSDRIHAIGLLARTQGAAAMPMLEGALAGQPDPSVARHLANALSRLRAQDPANALAMPLPPLPPAPTGMLGPDALDLLLANRAKLLARRRQYAEEEIVRDRNPRWPPDHRAQFHLARYETVTEYRLRLAITVLNGGGTDADREVLEDPDITETLELDERLATRPDMGLLQILRWTMGVRPAGWDAWHYPQFQAWRRHQSENSIDLRQVATLAEACGGGQHDIALAGLHFSYWSVLPQVVLPPAAIWPLYATRPALIDEGLDLAAGIGQIDLGCTLEILATFPAMPERWIPRLLELGTGDGKTHRTAARQALACVPDLGARVGALLRSTKQEVRSEAARWLADLGDPAAVSALNAALQKETREPASAALLSALERLGENLDAYLAPDKLLAQARKGLKAKAPAGMVWLALDGAPACAWAVGGAVEPDIVRWWVTLACKLKEPGGNALLARYLGLLAPGSRAALGRWLLHAFIARDTIQQSLEVGIAFAQAVAPGRYQTYQSYAQHYPDEGLFKKLAAMTPDQVFEQAKHEKMAEYLGTAIGEKGMLALVWGIPGPELTATLAAFMRDHYTRRGQIEALLEAASVSNDPGVIQFILAVARRYRTASVQEKARLLVARIAERNGWSADQLADRTMPTGGLDDTGQLALKYGSRTFTVTLDAAMKPVLHNDDGAVVAALPAPRESDPAADIKEAKALLATCRKEVKQVTDAQSARLYDAMCAGRAWPAAEWRAFLLQHPIAGRLAQRLVWRTGDVAFRPTEDGSLIDALDDEVALMADATIHLAHRALVTPEEAAAWVAHFKDYKVAPLFAQMTRPLVVPPGPLTGDTVADRLGWLSDTFTLRTAFTKLGYQRGATEDGGRFYTYTKDCGSAGLRVEVAFSGSQLPEENVAAALTTLTFRAIKGARGSCGAVALDQVPPVLLAEAWADYHTVAAACTGFDADWERKVPW